jgi:hypothetical protein
MILFGKDPNKANFTPFQATARVVSILATEGHLIVPKTLINATSKVNRLARRTVEVRGSLCGGHDD